MFLEIGRGQSEGFSVQDCRKVAVLGKNGMQGEKFRLQLSLAFTGR